MLFGGREIYDKHHAFIKLMEKHPEELGGTSAFRELSIPEMHTQLWTKIRFMHQNYPEHLLQDKIYEWPYWTWQEYT